MPAPAAHNDLPPAASALVVFLSSTIGDYEKLRREVQEVLLRKAECACFLSEDWVGGYDATVQKCRKRVFDATGFMLLLGFWYGSIPPGHDKSITQLEFEWALEKWANVPFPKMAVLKPKPGSDAQKGLETLAQALIPPDPEQREEHKQRLAQFHGIVDDRRHEWRTIRTFETFQDLREYALVIGLEWRGDTALAASKGQVGVEEAPAGAQLREDQLGLLGRDPQQGAIKKLLAGVASRPDVPAVAILVHGDEDAGQRAFLAHVAKRLLKGYYPKRNIGRIPPGSMTIEALVAWVGVTLGLPSTVGLNTPEALADRVADELKYQPLYFIIDRIGADYPGGVRAFRQSFWEPFWTRLKALRTQQHLTHRLVAIVADYARNDSGWTEVVVEPTYGMPIDFSRLIRLPRLEHFQESDLYSWLEELEVSDYPPGRRAQLVQRALTDESSGEPDGTPQHVFNRLMSEQLWPDGDHP